MTSEMEKIQRIVDYTITDKNFGVVILENPSGEIVVAFRNAPYGSDFEKRVNTDDFSSYLLSLDTLVKYIFPSIGIDGSKKITTTGFNERKKSLNLF